MRRLFQLRPPTWSASDYERYGIYLRDDGFAGLDSTYEGAGNCYALLWDSDDGRLRAGRLVEATWTDFFSPAKYVTEQRLAHAAHRGRGKPKSSTSWTATC